MEKSFWEKLGFKDKQKEDRNLKEAKDKTDKIYRYLKETIYKRYILILLRLFIVMISSKNSKTLDSSSKIKNIRKRFWPYS